MPAKNKSRSRPRSASRLPDPHEILALRLRASERRDGLLDEVRERESAGKRKKARMILREAETSQEWLTALEAEVRQPVPE